MMLHPISTLKQDCLYSQGWNVVPVDTMLVWSVFDSSANVCGSCGMVIGWLAAIRCTEEREKKEQKKCYWECKYNSVVYIIQ